MMADLQIASACLVSCDCSLAAVQTGRPLTLMAPFLSVSTLNSFSAGGWVPSTVLMSAETLSEIGVCLVFESVFGVKPPLKVSSRLPARTLTGFSAVAMPATVRAIRAPRAIVITRCLRISLCLSFYCGRPSKAVAVESLRETISPAAQTTTLGHYLNPASRIKERFGKWLSAFEHRQPHALALGGGAVGTEEGQGDPEHQIGEAAGQPRGGAVENLAVEQLVDAPGQRKRGDARQLDRGLGPARLEEAGELAQGGVAAGQRLGPGGQHLDDREAGLVGVLGEVVEQRSQPGGDPLGPGR